MTADVSVPAPRAATGPTPSKVAPEGPGDSSGPGFASLLASADTGAEARSGAATGTVPPPSGKPLPGASAARKDKRGAAEEQDAAKTSPPAIAAPSAPIAVGTVSLLGSAPPPQPAPVAAPSAPTPTRDAKANPVTVTRSQPGSDAVKALANGATTDDGRPAAKPSAAASPTPAADPAITLRMIPMALALPASAGAAALAGQAQSAAAQPKYGPRLSGPLLPTDKPDSKGPDKTAEPASASTQTAGDHGAAAQAAQTVGAVKLAPTADAPVRSAAALAAGENTARPATITDLANPAASPPAQSAAAPAAVAAGDSAKAPIPRSPTPASTAPAKRDNLAALRSTDTLGEPERSATLGGDLHVALPTLGQGGQAQLSSSGGQGDPLTPSADLGSLVDRLIAARAASQPERIGAQLAHADFGRIDLSFASDAGGMTVRLRSHDPDFAPTVQAAAGTASIAASPQTDSATFARSDPASAGGTASQGSGREHGRPANRATTSEPATDGKISRPDRTARRNRAGGIYA